MVFTSIPVHSVGVVLQTFQFEHKNFSYVRTDDQANNSAKAGTNSLLEAFGIMKALAHLSLLVLVRAALGHGVHEHFPGPAEGETIQQYAQRHVSLEPNLKQA